MSNETQIASLLGLIHDRHSFVVTSHARPDGDAIGSALGMMHLLHGLGKQAAVAFADPVPHPYRCLAGAEAIVHQLPTSQPDALILLECDSLDRSGFSADDYSALNARFVINIDHHKSGRPFADFNWNDPSACAVGMLVYELAIASGAALTPAMAGCLYAAILTDTGSFTFASTTAATFGVAQHLLQAGADANAIAQAVYFSNPASKVRLLGAALSNLQMRGELAWATISQDEMQRAGATVEDCEGVVNFLIAIEGVQAAALLREQPLAEPGLSDFRLSLRSKGKVDVARVAESFGGGGHRNASGCTQQGTLADVTSRVLAQLQRACTEAASAAHAAPSTLLA
jgi:phosphoesterase RecJ-like protein